MAGLTKREASALRMSLTKMTFALIGRKIPVCQCPGENDLGYTDSQKIYLNFHHNYFAKLKKPEAVSAVRGVFGHEALHCLLSDFNSLKRNPYINPTMPNSFEERLFRIINNVAEDSYIENQGPNFLGDQMMRDLDRIRAVTYREAAPISECKEPFSQFLSAFIQFGDAGLIKGEWTFPEARKCFIEALPLMEEVLTEVSSTKRMKISQEIMEISRPLWEADARKEEFIRQVLEEMEKCTGRDAASSERIPQGGGMNGSPREIPESATPRKSAKTERRIITVTKIRNEEESESSKESSSKEKEDSEESEKNEGKSESSEDESGSASEPSSSCSENGSEDASCSSEESSESIPESSLEESVEVKSKEGDDSCEADPDDNSEDENEEKAGDRTSQSTPSKEKEGSSKGGNKEKVPREEEGVDSSKEEGSAESSESEDSEGVTNKDYCDDDDVLDEDAFDEDEFDEDGLGNSSVEDSTSSNNELTSIEDSSDSADAGGAPSNEETNSDYNEGADEFDEDADEFSEDEDEFGDDIDEFDDEDGFGEDEDEYEDDGGASFGRRSASGNDELDSAEESSDAEASAEGTSSSKSSSGSSSQSSHTTTPDNSSTEAPSSPSDPSDESDKGGTSTADIDSIEEETELSEEDAERLLEELRRAIEEFKAEEAEYSGKDSENVEDFPISGGYKHLCSEKICKNIKVSAVTPSLMKIYTTYVAELGNGPKHLASNLERLFRADREERAYRSSGSVSLKRIAEQKVTANLCVKKRSPANKEDIEVVLLVDESGSMVVGDKYIAARKATIGLAEAFAILKLPITVIGFTADQNGADVVHYHYISGKNTVGNRAKLLNIAARSNNFDGYSIRYATALLKKSSAAHKILFVLSDGSPAARAYREAGSGVADTKLAIKEASKVASTFGILVGNGSPDTHREMYGYNFLHISKTDDLFKGLATLVKREIKKW